jgi:4-hydroxybenzoyl-CoA thioesterase/acyl-CoA thioester hydrolase
MSNEPFVYRRRIQFADTDMAGIVHFSSLFRIMEEAEHAFLRSLGLTVYDASGGGVTWPRVAVEAKFSKPAKFEDELEVHVAVASMTNKACTYDFLITIGEREIAHGAITAVCCRYEGGGEDRRLKSTPIPDDIAEKLKAHMAQG